MREQELRPHFHVLGVPVVIKPTALLVPLQLGVLAYVVARRNAATTRDSLLLGIASALFVYPTELTHAIGHIISSRRADAPMDYINWSIGAFNGYNNNDVSPRQHIIRSVGGPIASILAALVWLVAWQTLKGTKLGALAQVACLQNLLAGVGALAPLSMIDGGVILKNLRKL